MTSVNNPYSLRKRIPYLGTVTVVGEKTMKKSKIQIHIQSACDNDADPTATSVLLSFAEFKSLASRIMHYECFLTSAGVNTFYFGKNFAMIKTVKDTVVLLDTKTHHQCVMTLTGCVHLFFHVHVIQRMVTMFENGEFKKILEENNLV